LIYDRCGRDSEKAVEELATRILGSAAYMNEAAFIAARSIIGQQMSADRAKIFAGVEIPPPANSNIPSDGTSAPTKTPHEQMPSWRSPEAVAASGARLRSATINGLFGLTFRGDDGDVILGLATPEQLRPIAARYIATGTTSVQRGRFLERVCAAAKDGVAVSVSLTLKEVERFKKDAEKLPV
jgi:hypothetical protein